MRTVATMTERLVMSAEEAVEKLRYAYFDVGGVDAELSDEACDFLIDVDDDPSIAEKRRREVEKEKEKAQRALLRAAAKRKETEAAQKKKLAEEEQARENGVGAEVVPAPVIAEILPPAPVAEILSDTHDISTGSILLTAPPPVASVPKPKPKIKPLKKKKQAEAPSIIIGSAIDHEEHRAEVVRADGTHLDVVEVEILDPQAETETEEEEEEEVGLLAEAERRQEEEELRKVRVVAKPVVKPDPAVIAEVIRKANLQRELGDKKIKQKVKLAGAAGGQRKTGKTARKRMKKQERIRTEESMRRDAAAAVREYQAGGGAKKRKKRRNEDDETGSDEGFENLILEVEDTMTVEQLATAMELDTTEIILALMEHNILATKNQTLSMDLIRRMAEVYGYDVKTIIPMEEDVLAEDEDDPASLVPRAPVVTVMGHVDHGKTSLLDRVRKASVASGEAGGITQHIAAYEVTLPQGRVVFLDTPGHEAFTAMRARGAKVTDVVVLVVAADDGIMPQTVEAIHHAKAAEVPIVVAINKIDKPDSQPDRLRQELTRFELMDEQWGGTTIIKNISAKTGQGVDELMELLVLETELLELKANPNKRARGTIIESEITKGQGPVAWVLVQSGTLRVGDAFLAGETYGRVRAMQNSRGENVEMAGPSTPVVVTGFSAPAAAGDLFVMVHEERVARSIAEQRQSLSKSRIGTPVRHVTLEDFHARLLAGEKRELNIVVKADVQGSMDVLNSSLPKLGNDEVRVKIVHCGVGSINESDVLLASASDAVIIGFHVEASQKVAKQAQAEGVDIKTYKVIYEAIEDVRKALEGLLTPDQKEVITGHAEIRAVFSSSALGNIAGCYVTDGEIKRDAHVRLKRGNEVVHDGRMSSLKRVKDDASSVANGFECGIKLDGFDAIKEGDVIEAYRFESVAKVLA